jgi:hypothetical protein
VLLIYEQVRFYELSATGGKHGDPRWPAFARRSGFDPRRPGIRLQERLPVLPRPEQHRLGPVRMSWVPMRRQTMCCSPGTIGAPYSHVARPAGPVPMDQVSS